MKFDADKFSKTLKKKRAEAGLSLLKLSALTGVGDVTIMRMERGEIPQIKTFTKICQWLEIQPGEFFKEG